jgi:hypothetical protein
MTRACRGRASARPDRPRSGRQHHAESFRGADHLRRILAEAQAIVGAALTTLRSSRRLRPGHM